ncbi:MAG: hypothetical protein K2P99_04170, partial [Burkholderiales bacterium]|nr:hypothetical protein [Burkholderiales bacterium]
MDDQILETLIKSNRKLSDGTLKTYLSVLRSLSKKLGNKNGIEFFTNSKPEIIQYIQSLDKPQTQKTILSALYVLTNDNDYKTDMLKYVNEVNQKYKTQKTFENRKGLTTLEEIKSKYPIYLDNLKKNRNIDNYILYFIVALTSTVIMPPRRALDWTELKVKNYDINVDNCVVKNKFVLNKFKTARFVSVNEKVLDIPKELLKYINEFKKISENDYLLYNTRTGNKLDSSAFTKLLNKIYGDKVGVDLIRSLFLSDLGKGIPALTKLEDTTAAMGTSINSMLNYYVKKD